MKKMKHAPRKTAAKRKTTSHKKISTRKNATPLDWKAFSKRLLQDYALPLKKMFEQKITRLQHRWA